jgi:hypothetical protein
MSTEEATLGATSITEMIGAVTVANGEVTCGGASVALSTEEATLGATSITSNIGAVTVGGGEMTPGNVTVTWASAK